VFIKEFYQVTKGGCDGSQKQTFNLKDIAERWQMLSQEKKETFNTIAKTGKCRPPEEVAKAWGVLMEELNVNQVWRDGWVGESNL
jgi:hypothetical protein